MPALAVRLALGVALLVSGCAVASQTYTERDLRALCETAGGRWHAGVEREGFCEFQSPGMV